MALEHVLCSKTPIQYVVYQSLSISIDNFDKNLHLGHCAQLFARSQQNPARKDSGAL